MSSMGLVPSGNARVCVDLFVVGGSRFISIVSGEDAAEEGATHAHDHNTRHSSKRGGNTAYGHYRNTVWWLYSRCDIQYLLGQHPRTILLLWVSVRCTWYHVQDPPTAPTALAQRLADMHGMESTQ